MLINESPTIYAFGGDFSLYQISMPFAKGLWISMPKSPGGIPGPASFRSSDLKALYRLAELRGDVIRCNHFTRRTIKALLRRRPGLVKYLPS